MKRGAAETGMALGRRLLGVFATNRSDRAKMNLKQGMATACCILLPLVIEGCGGSKAASSPPAQIPEVSVVTVHKGSVPMTTELPGRTSPVLVAQVRSRVDGIVLARPFKEGADVSARQPLFRIDPAP